jgi:serine/threonine protein kinase
MVTDDGGVIIIDYDAARSPAPGETRDTVLMGTPGSAAPEQYGFGPSDCRTDIYALGVLLRDMFPDDSKIQKIAAQATRIDPTDRYYDVDELRRQLRYAGGTAGASAGSMTGSAARTAAAGRAVSVSAPAAANAAETSAAYKTAAKHLPILIAAAAAVSVALLLLAFGLMRPHTKDAASSAAVSSAAASAVSSAVSSAAASSPAVSSSAASADPALSESGFSLTPASSASSASSASIASSVSSASSAKAPSPAVIESGYHTAAVDDYTDVYCGMKIENPDAGKAIENTIITITARAADGHILASNDCPVPCIAAGDIQWYGCFLQYEESEQPASVDFSVSDPGDFVDTNAPEIFSPDDFTFSNVRSSDVTGGQRFTGELANNSTQNAEYISIEIIFYENGKIIGGDSSDFNNLPAGETRPFDFMLFESFPYDSFDLHVVKWF